MRKAPVFHGRGSSAGQILTSGWRVLVIGGALLQEQYSYEYFVFFARDSPSARGGAMLEAGYAASRHARGAWRLAKAPLVELHLADAPRLHSRHARSASGSSTSGDMIKLFSAKVRLARHSPTRVARRDARLPAPFESGTLSRARLP